MKKSIHTPEYQAVKAKLLEMREDAGLTHREMAQILGRENSFVWRIEHGERRLDIVEFYWVCKALNKKPEKVFAELVKQFSKGG